jgi:hypothetical protein
VQDPLLGEGSYPVLRPKRTLLPLGSVRRNSRIPYGMSSTAVTVAPSAAKRACQVSMSGAMT